MIAFLKKVKFSRLANSSPQVYKLILIHCNKFSSQPRPPLQRPPSFNPQHHRHPSQQHPKTTTPQQQPPTSQPSPQPQPQPSPQESEYTNWILARSAGHSHSISISRRQHPKDRYSIHRLTNIPFLQSLIKYPQQYPLSMNQKIVLFAQFNHVLEILNRNKQPYKFLFGALLAEIVGLMENPPDLICLGTLMTSLVSLEIYDYGIWLSFVDDILVNKFDQDFDQLFGIVIALARYRDYVISIDNYQRLRHDQIIPKLPIIYRTNLNTLRQFITHNIYNLKQSQLLFQALHSSNINQSYFWSSVRDWFNIYTKQQLVKKEMEEFFIMKESAVERVLHDHGVVRARPILQEVGSIAFILGEFGGVSWRFVEFAQDLILYAIDNGSRLFKKYQEIEQKEEEEFRELERGQDAEQIKLNKHMKVMSEMQRENLKNMEKKYRTIFINPIALKNQYIVQLLIVFSRAYRGYRQVAGRQTSKQQTNKQGESKNKQAEQQKPRNFYDKTNEVYLDPRVKRWLLLQLTKPQMQYTLKQLIQIHRCASFLNDTGLNLIDFISEKLSNLRLTNTVLQELKELMDILPPVRYNLLAGVLVDFLLRNHPSEILGFTRLIQQRHLFPYMAEYLLRLPKSVNYHQKYFSFEQNCYFLLILLQNAYSIESLSEKRQLKMNYEGHMEQLKESIKIVAYGRGFKISVNSYFHKVLDYIDVVEFFQGGR